MVWGKTGQSVAVWVLLWSKSVTDQQWGHGESPINDPGMQTIHGQSLYSLDRVPHIRHRQKLLHCPCKLKFWSNIYHFIPDQSVFLWRGRIMPWIRYHSIEVIAHSGHIGHWQMQEKFSKTDLPRQVGLQDQESHSTDLNVMMTRSSVRVHCEWWMYSCS